MLIRGAGPNDDTDPDEYQDKCADKFNQLFDSDEWDDWFDNEIEKEDEKQRARNARKNRAVMGGSGTRRVWKTPSDTSNKNLVAVKKYLHKLLQQAHDDDIDTEVYQKKCGKQFHQAFKSKAWDGWFDTEVEKFETSTRSNAVKTKKKEASSSEHVWETPSDMLVADLAAVLKYLGELVHEAGHDKHVETHVFQDKCAEKFNQDFDSDAWDDWFDETVEHLEQEDDPGDDEGHDEVQVYVENESPTYPVWDSPEDASKIGRAQVRSYLSELIENEECADADEYQEKCAKEFNQEFDSHAWDNWFDKEIHRLESK